MTDNSSQVIHCMVRARDSFDEAVVLAKSKLWNGTANRLYFACFYALNALMLKKHGSVIAHEDTEDKLSVYDISEQGKNVYITLYHLRKDDEHMGFSKFSKEQVEPCIFGVQKFINEVEWFLY